MAMAMSSNASWPSCKPQYQTPRSPNRPTRGEFVAKIARALGQPLMPWQSLVADVAGELLPDGTPAFREVIVTVPRQQGKTSLILATSVERCTLRDRAHKVAYTAQTGSDARKKLLDDQVPILEGSPLWAAVKRVHRAQGNEGVIFRNGSRIDVLASGHSAGHGKVIDLGLVDEAFDDQDDRREQAMSPAMMTKVDAQMMIASTMGTDASVYLNRKVDAGRAAALEGLTTGTAYFEWAIPEGVDITDPRSWWLGMPALGITVSEAVVAHEQRKMSPGEFARAFGNQRMRSSERVIPEASWRLVQSATAKPSGALWFGVEVSPDRDWTAIVAAGQSDRPTAEIVDYRPGVGWAADRLAQLASEHGGQVVLEARSPAGALAPELAVRGVRVTELSAGDVTRACGWLYDRIADTAVWVRSDPRLDTAVGAAARVPVGDAWRFGRKAGGDVTPLGAMVMALYAATGPQDDAIALVL